MKSSFLLIILLVFLGGCSSVQLAQISELAIADKPLPSLPLHIRPLPSNSKEMKNASKDCSGDITHFITDTDTYSDVFTYISRHVQEHGQAPNVYILTRVFSSNLQRGDFADLIQDEVLRLKVEVLSQEYGFTAEVVNRYDEYDKFNDSDSLTEQQLEDIIESIRTKEEKQELEGIIDRIRVDQGLLLYGVLTERYSRNDIDHSDQYEIILQCSGYVYGLEDRESLSPFTTPETPDRELGTTYIPPHKPDRVVDDVVEAIDSHLQDKEGQGPWVLEIPSVKHGVVPIPPPYIDNNEELLSFLISEIRSKLDEKDYIVVADIEDKKIITIIGTIDNEEEVLSLNFGSSESNSIPPLQIPLEPQQYWIDIHAYLYGSCVSRSLSFAEALNYPVSLGALPFYLLYQLFYLPVGAYNLLFSSPPSYNPNYVADCMVNTIQSHLQEKNINPPWFLELKNIPPDIDTMISNILSKIDTMGRNDNTKPKITTIKVTIKQDSSSSNERKYYLELTNSDDSTWKKKIPLYEEESCLLWCWLF